MISNIFYTVFFGLCNIFIYVKLQRSAHIEKENLVYTFITLVILVHTGLLQTGILMNTHDFFNIFFFSISLVILHYGTNFQVRLFKESNKPHNERQKQLQGFMLRVFDFMRQKLIYMMVSVYQLFAIWNERCW